MFISAIDLKVRPAGIDVSTYLNEDSAVPGNEDNTSTVTPRLTNFSANEDFFRCFSDSANEYGFG